jgi:low temperature requirement protein LtrA
MQLQERSIRGAVGAAAGMAIAALVALVPSGVDLGTILAGVVGGAFLGPFIYWRQIGHINDQIRRAGPDAEPQAIRLSMRHILTSVAIIFVAVALLFALSDGHVDLRELAFGLALGVVALMALWLISRLFPERTLRHFVFAWLTLMTVLGLFLGALIVGAELIE